MCHKLTLLILVIRFFAVCGQTPASKYYAQINNAEQEIINDNLEKALNIYVKTFEEFDYPFCRNIEQAFYISCYTHNEKYADLFLRKCLANGLTKRQFELYLELWSNENNNSELEIDYQILRSEHINKLDTAKLFRFIEFDVHRDILLNNLKRNSKSRSHYFAEMKKVRDAYISTIEQFGYPTERGTGSFFSRNSSKNLKKFNGELSHRIPLKTWGLHKSSYKYVSLSDNDLQILSLKPGNWFLTHYINPDNFSLIDSTLFEVLQNGFDSLKYDPLIIVNAMESTRQLKNEFALSYYSQLWAYELKFNYEKKFSLPDSVKFIINENRGRYFIRSIEKEELLYEKLYHLKFGLKMKNELTMEEANKVKDLMKDEIALFFNIF